MSQDNPIQLPTRASNSLRSKTIGRLSILSGKQTKTPNNETNPKSQTWSRATPVSPSPTPSPSASIKTIPRPNLTWEPGMFTLDYIQRNLPLPRVVLCDHTQCDKGRGTRGFDCGQLLMLRNKNEMLRVQAGSLAIDVKDSKTLVETEDRLVVPEDYKGWFAVLGTSMTLKAIPHYRQMAQLAQSDCSTFLISGTENVRSMKKMGESISESRPLCPGDILKMGTLDETGMYLHCTDDNDRDVLIPVESQGTFYVLKNKSTPIRVPILQIKDILQKCQFPCVVKLVYGREPTGEGVFTKMMVLEGVKQEATLLASTILKSRNTLHDLSLDIPNKFKIAVQSKDLVHNIGYISALNLCQDTGDLFVRSIKMFRHLPGQTPVQPRVSAMGLSFASKLTSESKFPSTKSTKGSPTPTPASVPQTAVAPPKAPVAKASPVSTSKAQTIQTPPQTLKPFTNNAQTSKKAPPVATTAKPQSSSSQKQAVSQTSRQPPETNQKMTPATNSGKAQSTPLQKQAVSSTIVPTETKVEEKVNNQTKQPKQAETTTISVNGSTKHDSKAPSQVNGESNQDRQRQLGSDLPPPAPLVTAIFVKGGVAPRPANIEARSQNEEKPLNGEVKTDRPPVQVVHLVKPETRPGAYEEVWTASSGKEDSANEELSSTSSSMSDFMTFGMGGQIVTGGLPEPQGKLNPSPTPPSSPSPVSSRPTRLPPPPPPVTATPAPVFQPPSKPPPPPPMPPSPNLPPPPPPPPHHELQPPLRPKLQTIQPQASSQQSPKPSPQQSPKPSPQQSPKPSSHPQAKPTPPFQSSPQQSQKPSPQPQAKSTPPMQSTPQPQPQTPKPKPTPQPQVSHPKPQTQIISVVPKPQPKPQSVPQPVPQPGRQPPPKGNIPAPQTQPKTQRHSQLLPIPTQNQPQPQVQTINVMTSKEKKIHAKTLLDHYSTIDIVEEVPNVTEKTPSNSKASRRESVYSEIEIVDNIPVIEGSSSSETDAEDIKASRKKKVSFSDILDVQTIPKELVTSIVDINEDDDDILENEYRDTRPKSDFSLDGWEIYTGRPSGQREITPNFGEFNMAQHSYTTTDYDDDSGYMMPVLDRKGRVKTQGHRCQGEPHHVDLAKRLSLPNMRVVNTREPSREYRRRDSEDDILW